MTRLSDVIRPVTGRAGPGTELPVYSVTKNHGFILQNEYFKKKIASTDTSAYKIVRTNQFAYATIHLDEGSIGAAPEDCIVSPMYTVFSVDESRVDVHYLQHLLRSPSAIARYQVMGQGSAERRKSISLKSLGSLAIPPIGLKEQRRIASILDEADAIRTKHNALLARFVELEHSAFNERFADSDWDSLFLSECATDMTIGLVRPGHATGLDFSHQYMKMDGITSSGHLDRSKFTFTDASPAELARYSIQDGDLLLNTRNSRELVGKTTVFRGETALFNNNLMRLRFDPRLLPDYVHAYLWSPSGQAALERIKSGTTSVFAIYAKDLTNLPIPAPPIAIQREFSASLAAIRTERDHVAKAVEADEELFAALQHRAFRGEL